MNLQRKQQNMRPQNMNLKRHTNLKKKRQNTRLLKKHAMKLNLKW